MSAPQNYVTRVFDNAADVDAAAWNALLARQPHPTPFMRHEYLAALQASGSATPATGWLLQCVTLWRGDTLQAACALYVKDHSYGEYVFDWAWANAYAQHGLAYYPKAVVAVPFTPVPGARLLAADAAARAALVQALVGLCERSGLSSLHLLFTSDDDVAACRSAGLMLRQTVQFHWKNVAPTLVTACTALPPEGADPAFGRPGGGGVAPTLVTACTALPPEGADPAFGRPGSGGVAPTLLTACASLPPEGTGPAFGRPGGGGQAPSVADVLLSGGESSATALADALPEGDAVLQAQRPVRFRDFEDFLASLSHDKRKKIRQERRKVAAAGVSFRWAQGRDIATADWDFFYRCYERTYLEHGNAPYLSRAFFQAMADTLADGWVLFIAEQEGRPIASSLIAVDPAPAWATSPSDPLLPPRAAYGRYWGALERVDCLHFEACFYQPLAWCIAHGIDRFEGGAQGEHKMARALMPTATTSAHWLAHPAFADAVERFLEREDAGTAAYLESLEARTPFKAG